jgi:hypothetical protein
MKKTYVIEVLKEWYGPSKTRHHLADYQDCLMTFNTRESAQAKADSLDQTVYELSHNESGRPTYTVINY